jgi:hemolysin activation/secretion protein
LLIAQLDFQFSSDSLLPSQQFAIGGQLLRGYRQNVRSGDNGFRFSLEDNITIVSRKNEADSLTKEPVLQIIPFVDVGMVWNHPGNPNELPDPNFLASVGLGVYWRVFSNLELRVDYGFPLMNLSDQGENFQDKGLQFRLNYNL